MTESQRLAYLEALDIPVWVPRGQARPPAVDPGPGCVRLGPGTGSTILICARPEQSSGSLASDIARSLAPPPVWAWPDESGDGMTVADAVQESLCTGLIVFGRALAERLLGSEMSDRVGPARVLIADDLEVLAGSAGARRELWRKLCAEGMVSAS